METYLIVGLGNPGQKYEHTRHNVGFDVVDVVAQKTGIAVTKHKSRALVGEGTWKGKRLVLVKPQTYMNLSGESVTPLVQWYKPDAQNMVVIYDDVDLPPGSLRIRPSGSSGTHNGMRSVIGLLGRSDFPRVRVGIGGAPQGWDLADWVISHYPDKASREVAFESYQTAADAVLAMVELGTEAAMRTYNRKGRTFEDSAPKGDFARNPDSRGRTSEDRTPKEDFARNPDRVANQRQEDM